MHIYAPVLTYQCAEAVSIPAAQSFSPNCTLHTTITHVISVLEQLSLTYDYAIGIHVRLHCSNTVVS